MNRTLFSLALISAFAPALAQATVDSYVITEVPAPHSQEEGYCMIPVHSWDGASSWESGAMMTSISLQSPLMIKQFMNGEGETMDANALSGTGITFKYEYDTVATLEIDVKEAFNRLSKSEAVQATKLAIYAGVVNKLGSSLSGSVRVTLKGLPANQGVSKPIPAKFQSAFSKGSPYLKALKTELGIRPSCNG